MEIKTCEQYVLAELEAAQRENERLRGQVAELEKKIEFDTNENLTIDGYCLGIGKRRVANDAVNTWRCSVVQDGRIITYEEWVQSVVRGDDIPPVTTKREFIEYMKPYLVSLYDEEVSKHRKEVEDDGGDDE